LVIRFIREKNLPDRSSASGIFMLIYLLPDPGFPASGKDFPAFPFATDSHHESYARPAFCDIMD
jgi:hypothetical protein